MSCPTCDHTMQQLGCCSQTGLAFWWCPRCGTIKPCDTEATAPDLVRRCRKFENDPAIEMKRKDAIGESISAAWRRLGISESINKPADR